MLTSETISFRNRDAESFAISYRLRFKFREAHLRIDLRFSAFLKIIGIHIAVTIWLYRRLTHSKGLILRSIAVGFTI